jgi:hypothetical protein
MTYDTGKFSNINEMSDLVVGIPEVPSADLANSALS